MSIFTKPRIPENLRELMKDLTREILKEKPTDIYNFAENYFQSRLPEKQKYIVEKFEKNSGRYDFSYLQNPQRYKIPVTFVYSIIPAELTNLIKELIKAILREQPQNLCEFAVEYFRHLKTTMKSESQFKYESKEVNYTAYENYFNNKERSPFNPYTKCICGRILGESQNEHLDSIHNFQNHNSELHANKIIIASEIKHNKVKGISETETAISEKYINSVLILQRCIRRYLQRKHITRKTNQMHKDPSIIKGVSRSIQMEPSVPQLQLNQGDTENIPEDASYTSASTVFLSASESVRDPSDSSTIESILTKTVFDGKEIENGKQNFSNHLDKSLNHEIIHPEYNKQGRDDNDEPKVTEGRANIDKDITEQENNKVANIETEKPESSDTCIIFYEEEASEENKEQDIIGKSIKHNQNVDKTGEPTHDNKLEDVTVFNRVNNEIAECSNKIYIEVDGLVKKNKLNENDKLCIKDEKKQISDIKTEAEFKLDIIEKISLNTSTDSLTQNNKSTVKVQLEDLNLQETNDTTRRNVSLKSERESKSFHFGKEEFQVQLDESQTNSENLVSKHANEEIEKEFVSKKVLIEFIQNKTGELEEDPDESSPIALTTQINNATISAEKQNILKTERVSPKEPNTDIDQLHKFLRTTTLTTSKENNNIDCSQDNYQESKHYNFRVEDDDKDKKFIDPKDADISKGQHINLKVENESVDSQHEYNCIIEGKVKMEKDILQEFSIKTNDQNSIDENNDVKFSPESCNAVIAKSGDKDKLNQNEDISPLKIFNEKYNTNNLADQHVDSKTGEKSKGDSEENDPNKNGGKTCYMKMDENKFTNNLVVKQADLKTDNSINCSQSETAPEKLHQYFITSIDNETTDVVINKNNNRSENESKEEIIAANDNESLLILNEIKNNELTRDIIEKFNKEEQSIDLKGTFTKILDDTLRKVVESKTRDENIIDENLYTTLSSTLNGAKCTDDSFSKPNYIETETASQSESNNSINTVIVQQSDKDELQTTQIKSLIETDEKYLIKTDNNSATIIKKETDEKIEKTLEENKKELDKTSLITSDLIKPPNDLTENSLKDESNDRVKRNYGQSLDNVTDKRLITENESKMLKNDKGEATKIIKRTLSENKMDEILNRPFFIKKEISSQSELSDILKETNKDELDETEEKPKSIDKSTSKYLITENESKNLQIGCDIKVAENTNMISKDEVHKSIEKNSHESEVDNISNKTPSLTLEKLVNIENTTKTEKNLTHDSNEAITNTTIEKSPNDPNNKAVNNTDTIESDEIIEKTALTLLNEEQITDDTNGERQKHDEPCTSQIKTFNTELDEKQNNINISKDGTVNYFEKSQQNPSGKSNNNTDIFNKDDMYKNMEIIPLMGIYDGAKDNTRNSDRDSLDKECDKLNKSKNKSVDMKSFDFEKEKSSESTQSKSNVEIVNKIEEIQSYDTNNISPIGVFGDTTNDNNNKCKSKAESTIPQHKLDNKILVDIDDKNKQDKVLDGLSSNKNNIKHIDNSIDKHINLNIEKDKSNNGENKPDQNQKNLIKYTDLEVIKAHERSQNESNDTIYYNPIINLKENLTISPVSVIAEEKDNLNKASDELITDPKELSNKNKSNETHVDLEEPKENKRTDNSFINLDEIAFDKEPEKFQHDSDTIINEPVEHILNNKSNENQYIDVHIKLKDVKPTEKIQHGCNDECSDESKTEAESERSQYKSKEAREKISDDTSSPSFNKNPKDEQISLTSQMESEEFRNECNNLINDLNELLNKNKSNESLNKNSDIRRDLKEENLAEKDPILNQKEISFSTLDEMESGKFLHTYKSNNKTNKSKDRSDDDETDDSQILDIYLEKTNESQGTHHESNDKSYTHNDQVTNLETISSILVNKNTNINNSKEKERESRRSEHNSTKINKQFSIEATEKDKLNKEIESSLASVKNTDNSMDEKKSIFNDVNNLNRKLQTCENTDEIINTFKDKISICVDNNLREENFQDKFCDNNGNIDDSNLNEEKHENITNDPNNKYRDALADVEKSNVENLHFKDYSITGLKVPNPSIHPPTTKNVKMSVSEEDSHSEEFVASIYCNEKLSEKESEDSINKRIKKPGSFSEQNDASFVQSDNLKDDNESSIKNTKLLNNSNEFFSENVVFNNIGDMEKQPLKRMATITKENQIELKNLDESNVKQTTDNGGNMSILIHNKNDNEEMILEEKTTVVDLKTLANMASFDNDAFEKSKFAKNVLQETQNKHDNSNETNREDMSNELTDNQNEKSKTKRNNETLVQDKNLIQNEVNQQDKLNSNTNDIQTNGTIRKLEVINTKEENNLNIMVPKPIENILSKEFNSKLNASEAGEQIELSSGCEHSDEFRQQIPIETNYQQNDSKITREPSEKISENCETDIKNNSSHIISQNQKLLHDNYDNQDTKIVSNGNCNQQENTSSNCKNISKYEISQDQLKLTSKKLELETSEQANTLDAINNTIGGTSHIKTVQEISLWETPLNPVITRVLVKEEITPNPNIKNNKHENKEHSDNQVTINKPSDDVSNRGDGDDQATTLSIGNRTKESLIGKQNLNIDRIRFYNEGLLGSISGQRFAETHLRSFWKEYLMNNSMPLDQYYYQNNETDQNQHLKCKQNKQHNSENYKLCKEQRNENVQSIILNEKISINKNIERIPGYFNGIPDTSEYNKASHVKPKIYKKSIAFTIPMGDSNKMHSTTKPSVDKELTNHNATNNGIKKNSAHSKKKNNLADLNLACCMDTEPLLDAETPTKLFQDLNQLEYEIHDIDMKITYTIDEIIRLKVENNSENNSEENLSEMSDYSLTPEPILQTIIEISESETPRLSEQSQSTNNEDFPTNLDKTSDAENIISTTTSKEDNSFISDELLDDKINSEYEKVPLTNSSGQTETKGGICNYFRDKITNAAQQKSETVLDYIAKAPNEALKKNAAQKIQRFYRQYLQNRAEESNKINTKTQNTIKMTQEQELELETNKLDLNDVNEKTKPTTESRVESKDIKDEAIIENIVNDTKVIFTDKMIKTIDNNDENQYNLKPHSNIQYSTKNCILEEQNNENTHAFVSGTNQNQSVEENENFSKIFKNVNELESNLHRLKTEDQSINFESSPKIVASRENKFNDSVLKNVNCKKNNEECTTSMKNTLKKFNTSKVLGVDEGANRETDNNNNHPPHNAEEKNLNNYKNRTYLMDKLPTMTTSLIREDEDIQSSVPERNKEQAARIIQKVFKKFIKQKLKLKPNTDPLKSNWFVGDERILVFEMPPLAKTKSEISFDETDAYIELATSSTQYLVDSSSNLEVNDENNFSRNSTAPIRNRSSSNNSNSVDLATDKSINLPKEAVSVEDTNITQTYTPSTENTMALFNETSSNAVNQDNHKEKVLCNKTLTDEFIKSERRYSKIVKHNYSKSPFKEIKISSPNINEVTKIFSGFIDSNSGHIEPGIQYEILEEPCIKKSVEDKIVTNDTSSSSDIDDTEDSLSMKTVKLQEPERAIIKMQLRRDSTVKITNLNNPKDYTFDEPAVVLIDNLNKDEETNMVAKLQRNESLESSGQSEIDVVIGSAGEKDNNFDFDCSFPTKCSLKRVHTISGDTEAKSLLKNVTIDESIKYIEPLDYEVNSGILYLDDGTAKNIRRKMMAYSLGEADSNGFEETANKTKGISLELKAQKYNDFNVSTALVDNDDTSTETESTIVSAATKIQAGARGYLTRKRLGKTNIMSQDDSNKVSFGNAAISESLEHLVQEAAAKRIQKFYRLHYRKKLAKANQRGDSSISQEFTKSVENSLSQKRSIMLQRGDALRSNSTPEEGTSSSNGSGSENKKLNTRIEIDFDQNKCLTNIESKDHTEQQSNEISTDTGTLNSLLSLSDKTIPTIRTKKVKDNKKRWLAMRQNSMPVQIDSEVLRVIPKYMRKKVKSADGEKKKI